MRNYNFYLLFCIGLFSALIPIVFTTNRYYGTYTVFGTGDTIINTAQAHFGPEHGKRRWNVECLDGKEILTMPEFMFMFGTTMSFCRAGEAVIGVSDLSDDFQKIVQVWCKFLFPYKQYTNGLYPYYPDCFVKNMTYQFHCYSPKYHDASVNSFVTGFWDNEASFFVSRKVVDDQAPYKCCKTPPNYYVDYQSCYYMPTRDQYGEYYDATYIILIYCATGYAMTGVGKKMNAYSMDYHLEWIQCCRIGFGAVPSYQPAHTQQQPYSYASYANSSQPNRPPAGYAAQYSGQNLGPQGLQRDIGSYSGGQQQARSDSDSPQQQMQNNGYSHGVPRSLDDDDDDILMPTMQQRSM